VTVKHTRRRETEKITISWKRHW